MYLLRSVLSIFIAFLIMFFSGVSVQAQEQWTFACQADNDLYRVMLDNGYNCNRFDSPAESIQHAEEQGIVFLLADQYPFNKTAIKESVWNEAKQKQIKLYVEYPDLIPGIAIGQNGVAHWERGVVASDRFGSSLAPMRILGINDCHFFDVQADDPLIVLARVAGFDTAVYGLPDKVAPILFQHPETKAWIASTKLSQFVSARYAPYEAWQAIWQLVLSDLCGRDLPPMKWIETVRPALTKEQIFPQQGELAALKNGVEWFAKSRLLVHPSEEELIDLHLKQGYTDLAHRDAGWVQKESRVMLPDGFPQGDGNNGFLEGYSSKILYDGSQMQRIIRRSDCMAEAAMGFSYSKSLDLNSEYMNYARNLLDFVYFNSSAQQGVRADVDHPAYGLIAWGTTNWGWERATYGDDMARVMLATMTAASLLQSDRWDEGILKCLLGSLRTTGTLGFRHNRIDIPNLEKNGWQHYYHEQITSVAPHFQAYLWACYLWAYNQTGYQPFLDQSKKAIRITMDSYPDGWHWTNGLQQERARMLLPLSWLVRIEDTPQHRQWLRQITTELLKFQQSNGALREQLGALGKGSYGPPQSNEAYGTSETPLIHENGDPVCDLLYTTNFAFLGLHEAAYATGDKFYSDAADLLAQFLSRIQIQSQEQPELDGAWFRAFDYNRWKYWASDADHGWGAWSIESGWTQGWIVSVLGMREMKTSLWDMSESSTIEKHFDKLQPVFFKGVDQVPKPKILRHAAQGKPIQLHTAYSSTYSALGDKALVDGFIAKNNYPDSSWQGYEGNDLQATVDLQKNTELNEIKLRCLQKVDVGIFLPVSVDISISTDGENYEKFQSIKHDVSDRTEGLLVHAFTLQLDDKTARYVKITANNRGTIPAWHHSKGKKAWLFADEIIINPEDDE